MKQADTKKERLFVVVTASILFLFTVVAVMSAMGTYRISIEGSRSLLDTRALDIAVNTGLTLERIGLKQDLFPGIVRTAKWQDLAFIALYDKNGLVVLHSNPLLVGRIQPDDGIRKALESEAPFAYCSTLATGEEVFVLDFPLRLSPSIVTLGFRGAAVPDGSADEGGPVDAGMVFSLRVALHPFPAREVVRKANLQLVLVGLSIVILWVLAAFFLAAWKKGERLAGELVESERMATLGKMAAVLAHEIRNPLSSIKGFAQIHLSGADDPVIREDMGIIVDESRRLEALTEDLLAYARPMSSHPSEFGLERFGREMKKVVQVPDSVDFNVEWTEGSVFLDREKLLQVARNLVQNAVDAVLGRPGAFVRCRLGIEKGVLVLAVEDNGPGIPDSVKKRLYEPFVTTKTRGTGLGLAIVRRLVDAMGGSIFIHDREGGGTGVLIHVPCAEPVETPGEERHEQGG